MDLINWKPLSEIDTMFGRLGFPKRLLDSSDLDWQPTADICETDEEYLIKADLPEVDRKDIRLTVDNGIITITGERRRNLEEKGERTLRKENFYGSFSRSFSLPSDVDADGIKASKEDGVLTVRLPRSQPRKARSIDITVE